RPQAALRRARGEHQRAVHREHVGQLAEHALEVLGLREVSGGVQSFHRLPIARAAPPAPRAPRGGAAGRAPANAALQPSCASMVSTFETTNLPGSSTFTRSTTPSFTS